MKNFNFIMTMIIAGIILNGSALVLNILDIKKTYCLEERISKLEKRIDIINKDTIKTNSSKNSNSSISSRIRIPKLLKVQGNGSVKMVYETGIASNGKFYGMFSGYAIAPGDSGRLINDQAGKYIVYPSDPKYYMGHEIAYNRPKKANKKKDSYKVASEIIMPEIDGE